jgi:hypothetical protein
MAFIVVTKNATLRRQQAGHAGVKTYIKIRDCSEIFPHKKDPAPVFKLTRFTTTGTLNFSGHQSLQSP